jgi:hypothetical protein
MTIAKKSHKTEKRTREIRESFCDQPGCRFRGKPAQQGVCHTTETITGDADWTYVDKLIAYGDQHLANVRASAKRMKWSQREYVSYLESEAACQMSNNASLLDELVRNRTALAIAKAKLAKRRR